MREPAKLIWGPGPLLFFSTVNSRSPCAMAMQQKNQPGATAPMTPHQLSWTISQYVQTDAVLWSLGKLGRT